MTGHGGFGTVARKRLRLPSSDAEGSPDRPPRNSRRRWASAYSPSPSPSPSPVPSSSPHRSPSPSPCRSWSQRLPSADDGEADDRSRSRGSDEVDRHGRPLWRPSGYRGSGEQGHGDGYDYDRLFTCKCCHRLLGSPVLQILKDETTREQYDYAVAHPEEVLVERSRKLSSSSTRSCGGDGDNDKGM